MIKTVKDWVRYAEPIAYRIGLKPFEFPQLTPLEFYKYLEADDERRRLQDYRAAYFISWLMSPHLKEPIEPHEIADPLWVTKEDKVRSAKEEMAYLKQIFGLEGGA